MRTAHLAPIGVITNNAHSVFQSLVISGIQEVADKRGYRVVIDSLSGSNGDEWLRPISLDPSALSGIIIIANAAPSDFLQAAYRQRTPLSFVSHYAPDIPSPVVMANNAQGIAELVKYVVVRCQRRQLAFVRGIKEQSDGIEREAAFRQELLRYNLQVPPSHFLNGEFSPTIAVAAVADLLDSGATFDAIIVSDYLMAIAIVDYLRGEGIDVPGQVSVVGFGDAAEAERAGLTTVAADIQQLGRHTANQIISQIEGLHIRGITRLSVELVVRET
jgi:DNA-binding LacI/PurR family transcriptional regulator